jgi:hypothetical protein
MRHTTTLDVRLEHGETREFQSGKPARPVILPANGLAVIEFRCRGPR